MELSKNISIQNLLKLSNNLNLNNEITIQGWVRTLRQSGKTIVFCNINDGSNVKGLQLIYDTNNYNINEEDINNFCNNIKLGSFLTATGLIKKSIGKGQDYELHLNKYTVSEDINDDLYPLCKSRMNIDTLRKIPHFRGRTSVFGSIFRIRSSLFKSIHDFYNENDFLLLDPNIITINECEGGAGVFQLTENNLSHIDKLPLDTNDKTKYDWKKDHFEKPVYLTVSSQLQLEAMACSMGNVYTTNKSFRSEHSSTNKHVSEFTHLEIEMITNNMKDIMINGERCIKYCINSVLKKNNDDIQNLNRFVSKGLIENLEHILNSEFLYKTYKETIEEINNDIKNNKKIKLSLINYGDDLSSDHENYLTKKYNTGIFVTHWPLDIKSFYMKQMNDNTCESFDLLMPYGIGELIGGSMREESYNKLINAMKNKNVNMNGLEFYIDLRKYGTCPHGGFGMGIDRLLMLITGMSNIKDVIPFPVYYKNCKY